MDVKLLRTTLLLIIVAAAAVAGVIVYNQYIEPQNDGPMERAGERLDKALDGN